jgi:hypothetical protein
MSQIGRSSTPETIRLQADDILRSVTFSVSDHWDGNDKNKIKLTIIERLYGFLNRNPMRDKVTSSKGSYVEIALADGDDQDAALNLLHTANIPRMQKGIAELTLDLEVGSEVAAGTDGRPILDAVASTSAVDVEKHPAQEAVAPTGAQNDA